MRGTFHPFAFQLGGGGLRRVNRSQPIAAIRGLLGTSDLPQVPRSPSNQLQEGRRILMAQPETTPQRGPQYIR